MKKRKPVKTIRGALRRAIGVLSKRGAWTRYINAAKRRGDDKVEVSPTSSTAECFCMRGAVMRAVGVDGGNNPKLINTFRLLDEVAYKTTTALDAMSFNDAHAKRKRDVIRLLERAAARHEARAAL